MILLKIFQLILNLSNWYYKKSKSGRIIHYSIYRNKFSSLSGIKFSSVSGTLPTAGNIIRQTVSNTNTAKGYVASYDAETKVLKYFQDRSLFFNGDTDDQTDFVGVSPVQK